MAQQKIKKQEEKKELERKKQEYMEEWGFQSEESKKIFEARWKKMQAGKAKPKNLTAEEKYKRFLANSKVQKK